MSASNVIGNRNSTPETSTSGLRPFSSYRNPLSPGHHLRSSADMSARNDSTFNVRAIRPASEVYANHHQQLGQNQSGDDDQAAAWIADIDQYENTLEEMADATLDQDFKDELGAIEQWFKVLSEAERTAALYALLQQATAVQTRFFIGVLQQMAKTQPVPGVISPSNYGEKDPMSNRLSAAIGAGSRNSVGRSAASPGGKRMSGLDQNAINALFPDAAAAIAAQKDEYRKSTGLEPKSSRNSTIDASSLAGLKDQTPLSPWGQRTNDQSATSKSISGQPQMGQFTAPPPSAGLRNSRPTAIQGDSNVHNQTINAPDANKPGMGLLSPYYGSSNWASMTNTPMVGNFPQTAAQLNDVANVTAMKLQALQTVNNRVSLDDARKFRKKSTDGGPMTPGMQGANIPQANFVMTNEFGQALTPQQAMALQNQQLAAMDGRRSRSNSPGILTPGSGGVQNMGMAMNNGLLAAYNAQMQQQALVNGMGNLNLAQFGAMNNGGDFYDPADIQRGRSPRGKRGNSRPPEDPTDLALLKDVPAWLRSLRLHKYNDQLKDLDWTVLVQLDDAALDNRGVHAQGARRKLLKAFQDVREAQEAGKL